ncbi:MAG: glucose-6-phosphate isomerase [Oscillospiraceae bacterium]|nr:glucose-6-phosphate isomerase [Oscillospiraceae bacterium]
MIKFRNDYLKSFITEAEIAAIQPEITTAHNTLHNRTGPGNDFTGWLDLPKGMEAQLERIAQVGQRIAGLCDTLIVIGVGGSYLGARAALEFIRGKNYNAFAEGTPTVHFVGTDLCPDTIVDLLNLCRDKSVCLCVVSKSGGTTEPAVAFRIFRQFMEEKYGAAATERIYTITDEKNGSLRALTTQRGYTSFVIPGDVGGRFSVLSPVGLLPLAAAGVDIKAIIGGAQAAKADFADASIQNNDCYRYAAARNILYRRGLTTEIMAFYDPSLAMFAEWWKQLFGESEGKGGQGIFPASVCFTTDLHSLGQYVQDGKRNLFETVLSVTQPFTDIAVPHEGGGDGLDFLSGKSLHHINTTAMEATAEAHVGGGVPNIILEVGKRDAYHLGYAAYFFQLACGVSAYTLGVNPFDQPGVEEYKKAMFRLLGKPE